MARCRSNGHTTSQSVSGCIECSLPQLARNNYFTGKLLVERDFTDEQRYHIGKDRRHSQWLHGWGSVCGLKVKQHPDPGCQSKYLVIEPGMAIDCCGREILINEETVFDFQKEVRHWWQNQNGEYAEVDDKKHVVQIQARYHECLVEEVPILFDECNIDGAASAHNRVQETYDLGVVIDPVIPPEEVTGMSIKWRHTINLDKAARVAVDEKRARVYVLTSPDPAHLYVYQMDNHSLVNAQPIPGSGLDLALSADGNQAYVAVEQCDPDHVLVLVLDTGKLGSPAAVVRQLPLSCPAGSPIRLAASPADGRLYVLNAAGKQVIAWDSTINYPGGSHKDALLGYAKVGERAWGIVVTQDGRQVIVANSGSASLTVIAAEDLKKTTTIDLPHEAPYALALAAAPAKPRLFAADRENKALRILDLPPGPGGLCKPLGERLDLSPNKPLDLVVSSGGRWVYLLLEDPTGKGLVVVVDAFRMEAGEDCVMGVATAIGQRPQDIVLAPRAMRLYAAFEGLLNMEGYGGVAVIDAVEEPCLDILNRSIEDCPTCPTGEWLVLATIEDYVFGQEVTDKDIDNLADRHLLPSVDLLTEVVKCTLDGGVGAAGRGEPGPPGEKGVPGEKGDPGEPGKGLNPHLSHICAINWKHGNYAKADWIQEQGLLVAFDRPVRMGDIHSHSFQLLVERLLGGGIALWGEVRDAQIQGVYLLVDEETCTIRGIDPTACEDPDDYVNGAQFLPSHPLEPGEYRVRLKGDLIRDQNCQAVDGDHLPPWLPERHSGDWVEGGDFESWFTIPPMGGSDPYQQQTYD